MKDKLKKVKKPIKLLKSKKKKMTESKKKKIALMSVDEFMSGFMSEKKNEDNKLKQRSKKQKTSNITLGKSPKMKIDEKENTLKNKNSNSESNIDSTLEDGDENEAESDVESNLESESKVHKKNLDNLKKSDPEFYKYLEENDQELLNFSDSDNESEEGISEKFHRPPESLEVASDESDYEIEPEVANARKEKRNKVTVEMVGKWQKKLQTKCKIQDLRDVTEAFHAAVVSISSEEDPSATYKVEGAVVFNSVIRMCVTDFLPAIKKQLNIKDINVNPAKCKNWFKIKPLLKNYLLDLAEISTATSLNMLRVLLKHIHQLCPFIVCFPILPTKFLKRIVQLWAGEEDVLKVLAFLCALRLANLRTSLLRRALKVMHMTYVRNTKFVTPNALPGINFMRQSLCEMFALDNTISYHMVFLYIRQLAIHLRSAVTQKKKESYKIVYSWTYISSLHLWAELFGIIPKNSPLCSLIYPLVQIIIGTIKLIPSSTYYPLRFHCCKILINLGNKCNVFVPVLPFLLEILRDYNFKREHKKLTVKPLDFTCLLRCSKSQMKENGFKDAIIENIYMLLMEYLAVECYRISFPDLMVPVIIQLKRFLKTCKFTNYNKKLKSIVDKILENSKFIEEERKKLTLKIDDIKGVEVAEAGIRAKEPPFMKFYESWKKIYIQQQARKLTNNQTLGDLKLPVLDKLSNKRAKKLSDGPAVLFPSDDDDDDDDDDNDNADDDDDDYEDYNEFDGDDIMDEEPEPPKRRKKSELQKKSKSKIIYEEEEEEEEEEDDIVKDFNYSEFK